MKANDWYDGGVYFTENNIKSFYRIEGSGPFLLCIHGFPSSSWDFDCMWSNLTRDFTVIAPDLLGLGKSQKELKAISVLDQADRIELLFINLKIESAHILAHDLGDTVAQELLARQVNGFNKVKWKSCVLLNGGLFPETHKPLFIQKLLISPLGEYISPLVRKKSFDRNMKNIFSKAHPPSQEFLENSWKLLNYNKGKKALPKLIRYMRERKEKRERWVEAIVNSTLPIRLINGIEDPISGEHMVDRYEEIIPNSDVVRLSNSGHYPHIETPKEVLKAFFNFHGK